MFTENEINAIELSQAKKDFYQIWNELVEVSSKLSSIWQISSTNESDPGVVLLKVLAAIADKLNYQIDVNTLEAFLPSAAQEESVRKLCEMLGYAMKYYQSATTTIKITYNYIDSDNAHASDQKYLRKDDGRSVEIGRYTNIKNADNSINYVTLDPCEVNFETPSKEVEAIEGELVECETSDDNIISMLQLDDNYRYYLPTTMIAENGIFVTNVNDGYDAGKIWAKVDNLNTQRNGYRCWKFGFDSKRGVPYIQFPEDVSTLIEDGLKIKYILTHGADGNVAARVLTNLQKPENWAQSDENNPLLAVENFTCINESAATTGCNKESLDDAYINYKKTVGTFDTLVTCRDYMNKIYQLTEDQINKTPLVSNVIVSDIRDDINYTNTICSFTENGVQYKTIARPSAYIASNTPISHFDLILYPFRPIVGAYTADTYKSSFTYSNANNLLIESQLQDIKTISHRFMSPRVDDIACIKNYLKLNARITTVRKVNKVEEASILKNIDTALFTKFNMRKVDFGEELPFDEILSCIERADQRIKNVALEEPLIETKVCRVGSTVDTALNADDSKALYNRLALRNVLAGRVALFNYNEDFKPEFTDKAYPTWNDGEDEFETVYPTGDYKIDKLVPGCSIAITNLGNGITLAANEAVQFRAPNFRTIITYPAYVNYYFHKNDTTPIAADTEYKLQSDEYLAINYLQATDAESNEKRQVNEVLTDCIIKPNFLLQCSDGATNYNKRSGFSFPGHPEIEGMFTMGTTDQIERRDVVKIELDSGSYIYWERKDEAEVNGVITFSFDEPGDTYTLKDGEYICYTNAAKTDMAYYGAGTVITKPASMTITKSAKDAHVDLSEVAEKGLLASIPWKYYSFEVDNALVVQEYQYLTLAKGSVLKSVIPEDTTIDSLSNTFINIESAEYKLVDDTESKSLPTLALGSDIKWQACSKLVLDVGPVKGQVLRKTANITDYIDIYYKDVTEKVVRLQQNANVPLSIKTNVAIQSAGEVVKAAVYELNLDGTLTETNNFKLKTYSYAPAKDILGNPLPLYNYGSGNWTKFTFVEIKNQSSAQYTATAALNVNFDNTVDRCLLMVFYADENYDSSAPTNAAKLTASNSAKIKRFNSTETALADYYLKPGVNVIEISKSCGLTLYADVARASSVIMGLPDFVPLDKSKALNPAIAYKAVDESTAYDQILKDILVEDPTYEFYYNAIVDNSTAIDLNKNLFGSTDGETLSTPRIWYDYNNINNKFVVSEIDADYLSKGIVLTNSSKL